MPEPVERRLAAIMFTDIVGYRALVETSKEHGQRVRERIVEIVRARVAEHGGSLAEGAVDETFSTFPTALSAVSCAVAVQEDLRGESILVLRIGVHQGELGTADSRRKAIELGAAIARTTAPGGIRVSAQAFEELRGRLRLGFTDLGPLSLGEAQKTVRMYAIHMGAEPEKPASVPTAQRRLAAIMFTDIVGSTALMAKSEPVALRVKQRHRTLVRTQVDRYDGEFIEAPGDETLSIFGSALDAVSCALAIQAETEAED